MNPLKSSSNVYIGFRHWIITAITEALFVAVALYILGSISLPQSDLWEYLPAVLYFIGIWLGVMYSARYLKKTFILSNPKMITNYSIMWFIVVQAFFISLPYILKSFSPLFAYPLFLTYGSNDYFSAYSLIVTCVEIVLFYFLSKKYIKNN